MLETIRNAWKIEDLKKKLLYTLLILALVRIGAAIPVPFLEANALKSMVSSGGLFSYLDLMTGGSFSNSTLFALSITPYITASIVIQLLSVAIPYLENLAKEGEEGRKKINKITRYTTLGLALLQSFGYMRLLASQGAVKSFGGGGVDFFIRLVIVMCFTAGAMLVTFLGERIDEKGIGNGISMILFVGIVSRAGAVLKAMIAYVQYAIAGYSRYWLYIPLVIALFLFIVVVIIIMTNAERRIPVQYAKRVVGRRQYGGQSTYLPIKVNMSGVLPVIFASTLLAIPTTILAFLNVDQSSFTYRFLNVFRSNSLLYAVLYFFLIIAFNYFYLSIQYNPIEISNNLRKNSGAIPGIRPGKPTSDYIARIVNKTTFLGGLFLAFIAVLPIILSMITGMNISLGGTSIIILVGVALDTVRALESQMMMRHYKGFLE